MQHHGNIHDKHALLVLIGRTNKSHDMTNIHDTQKRTFLGKFLGEFNRSFYDIHNVMAIHTTHMPDEDERTFFIAMLEGYGGWREVNGGGGPFT